jgi:hypothetical protein
MAAVLLSGRRNTPVAYTRGLVADLPFDLASDLSARLASCMDLEGKIPRALAALGAITGGDVVLLDGSTGLRAQQLSELGARLTVLERPAVFARISTESGAGDAPATDRPAASITGRPAASRTGTPAWQTRSGTAAVTGLPAESADAVISCWSSFREDGPVELVEAERVLRPGGHLLVLHDYGRDDVSRLRPPDLPEYTSWSRRDGWFLRTGFKVRVIHCWWTFERVEDAVDFLAAAFAEPGRTLGSSLKRPRLSYNVAIYHRTKPPRSH